VEIHLTPTEYRLLRHLAERPGSVVGHAELLTAVWAPDTATTSTCSG